MQKLKLAVFWLIVIFLVLIDGVGMFRLYEHNRQDFFESILTFPLASLIYSRAFYVDKLSRQSKNEEVVSIITFVNSTPVLKLFILLLMIKPYTTPMQNEGSEKTRKTVNTLTYFIYPLLLIQLILSFGNFLS